MTLTSKRQTQIADEEVDRMLRREKERAESIYEDGGFIGDVQMPGPERLDRYWLVTKDLTDLQLIASVMFEPKTEEYIRLGYIDPPLNPYWKNLLREPGEFTNQARDFMTLNDKYQGRYDQ